MKVKLQANETRFHVAEWCFTEMLLGLFSLCLQTEAYRWPSKQFTNTSHFAAHQQIFLTSATDAM